VARWVEEGGARCLQAHVHVPSSFHSHLDRQPGLSVTAVGARRGLLLGAEVRCASRHACAGAVLCLWVLLCLGVRACVLVCAHVCESRFHLNSLLH